MNPHRVKVTDYRGRFRARCLGCDWEIIHGAHVDAALDGVRHQVAHQDDHEIRRRTDWTEPMEDM